MRYGKIKPQKLNKMTLQELRKVRRDARKVMRDYHNYEEVECALSIQCWSVEHEDDEPYQGRRWFWNARFNDKKARKYIKKLYGKEY